MTQVLTKNNIRKKTIETGSLTLLSRAFGLVRELILARYLGVADTFWAAYRIPNFFRKIFAEGALSAAFVPSVVHTMRTGGKHEVNALMTLVCIVFEGLLLLFCSIILLFSKPLLALLTPGFTPEQIVQTVPMLVVLTPFVFFISGCALFAGALQAVNHFFIPAVAPILFNAVLIVGLMVSMACNFPTISFCYLVVIGGFVQFLAHVMIYLHLRLGFTGPTRKSLDVGGQILLKFVTCIPGMAMAEVSLFIDTAFASYIPGAISGLQYANRFMGIPLGAFATAFSTILLPHFSRISSYAPRRLSFYLLESTKLIFWVTVPVTLGMMFFAHQIFYTLFVSEKFSMAQAVMTGNILIASVAGLFFFSLNKILLNIYYASHNTFVPAIISVISMGVNIILNFVLIRCMQAPGLALGTTIAAAVQTALSLFFLYYKLNFSFYGKAFLEFLYRYTIQLAAVGGGMMLAYAGLYYAFGTLAPSLSYFLLHSMGFWLWVGPLCAGAFLLLLYTRKLFKVKLYFLD